MVIHVLRLLLQILVCWLLYPLLAYLLACRYHTLDINIQTGVSGCEVVVSCKLPEGAGALQSAVISGTKSFHVRLLVPSFRLLLFTFWYDVHS
jgi:hypothetical protein